MNLCTCCRQCKFLLLCWSAPAFSRNQGLQAHHHIHCRKGHHQHIQGVPWANPNTPLLSPWSFLWSLCIWSYHSSDMPWIPVHCHILWQSHHCHHKCRICLEGSSQCQTHTVGHQPSNSQHWLGHLCKVKAHMQEYGKCIFTWWSLKSEPFNLSFCSGSSMSFCTAFIADSLAFLTEGFATTSWARFTSLVAQPSMMGTRLTRKVHNSLACLRSNGMEEASPWPNQLVILLTLPQESLHVLSTKLVRSLTSANVQSGK